MSWDVGRFTPLGHGGSAFGTAAAGTVTLPAGLNADMVKIANLYVGGAAINFRDDGTAPLATAAAGSVTAGYPISAGADWRYEGMIENLQIIPQSGTVYLRWALYG